MTRLLHLATYKPDQRGSFVPFLLAVLTAARDRGWAVEAVFPEQARGRFWLADFEAAGVPVQFASGSRRSLARWLDRHLGESTEPTILHTHFTGYDISAVLAARKRPHLHVYWHIHTVLSPRMRAVAANAVKFGLLGRHVDRILTPASSVADGVARRLGNRDKISVLPNPVDPDAFPALSARQRAEFRRELGVPAEAQVLLHFGRDWRLKGGEVFLDALAELAEDGLSVFGIFSRGGSEAKRHVSRRGLGDRVKMVDLLPNPQVLYGAADVMVAPSRGEGAPFTVVESLCSGTPVVASDLSGHRFFADALEACEIAPRDPRSFAIAIRSFLEMGPVGRARRCDEAREWIVARLDVDVVAERLVGLYEKTVEGDIGDGRSVERKGMR